MNKRDFIKLIKKKGFYQLPKRGKGSHEVWTDGERFVTVSIPDKSDYDRGTLNQMMKDVGLK